MVCHICVLMLCGTSCTFPCISVSISLDRLAMDCCAAAPMRYVLHCQRAPSQQCGGVQWLPLFMWLLPVAACMFGMAAIALQLQHVLCVAIFKQHSEVHNSSTTRASTRGECADAASVCLG